MGVLLTGMSMRYIRVITMTFFNIKVYKWMWYYVDVGKGFATLKLA